MTGITCFLPVTDVHMYLSLEILRIGRTVKDFHEMKEDVPLPLNGVVLGHVCLEVRGKEVEGGDVSCGVDTEQLEESVDVFSMRLAVDEETFD